MKIEIDISGKGLIELTLDQARELYKELKIIFDKEVKPPYIDPSQFPESKKLWWEKNTPPYTTMAYAVQPPPWSIEPKGYWAGDTFVPDGDK